MSKKKNNTTTTASGGLGFMGALAILFIALKLLNQIDWSWWWVTCPLWGPLAVLFAGLIVFLLGVVLYYSTKSWWVR